MNYQKDVVSIIIPVFNTGSYLNKCLESVINQTYQNIDIILINDGSNDQETIKIIDKYYINPKIRYFNNRNMGISLSRNYGLDRIKGEYLIFVDSDDYLELNMIEKMVKKLKEDKTDLVQASFYVEYEHFKLRRAKPKNTILDKISLFKELNRNMGVNNYLWGKLYKSTLFDNVRFNADYLGFEDVEIMPKILMNVNKASLMKDRFYHYVQRKGSYTNKMNLAIAMDMFNSFKIQEEYMNKYLPGNNFSNHEQYYRSELMIFYILLFNKKINIEEFNLPIYSKDRINCILRTLRKMILIFVNIKYQRGWK